MLVSVDDQVIVKQMVVSVVNKVIAVTQMVISVGDQMVQQRAELLVVHAHRFSNQ